MYGLGNAIMNDTFLLFRYYLEILLRVGLIVIANYAQQVALLLANYRVIRHWNTVVLF